MCAWWNTGVAAAVIGTAAGVGTSVGAAAATGAMGSTLWVA